MKSELEVKHSLIKSKLKELAKEKIKKGQTVIVCRHIGKNLGLNGQTVYNYIKGKVKDGYLAESIYKELKKYKSR